MFSVTLKVLRFLWPFVREMVLGEKTLPEAVKTNKGRVFIIGLIFVSFVTNLYIVPKVWSISSDYIDLKKTHEALLAKSQNPAPVAVKPTPTVKPPTARDSPKDLVANSTPATPAPTPPTNPTPPAQTSAHLNDRFDRWKATMRRLQEYEDGMNPPIYQ